MSFIATLNKPHPCFYHLSNTKASCSRKLSSFQFSYSPLITQPYSSGGLSQRVSLNSIINLTEYSLKNDALTLPHILTHYWLYYYPRYYPLALTIYFTSLICLKTYCSNIEVKRAFSQSLQNHAKVGFIGVGNMGANMATHLQKAGHQLVLYDPNQASLKSLADAGAKIASNPAEVASQVERVITMVPTPDHVLGVYLGSNGVIANAKKGTILIDSSTVDPDTSRTVEAEASKNGIQFVDAPVSGAVPAARAGTLTFMVGGPKETVDDIRELLLCMGKNVIHCGPIGMGAAAKLCNNMMLAISMIGTSETLNLGERLGLDPKLLTQILNISSGRTWVSEGYNPVPKVGDEKLPSNNGYNGGFKNELIAKDLNLAQKIAVSSISPTPMGSLASQIYRMMKNSGLGEKDFSYAYQFLKEKN